MTALINALDKQLDQTHARAVSWQRAAFFRRFLVFSLAITQTVIGTYYMVAILPYHGGTALEVSLAAVFAILFWWIASGFWVAVLGFFLRRGNGDRYSLLKRHPPSRLAATPLARTAIVMPLYHEPVDRSMAGLRAVYESLRQTSQLDHFDFFILSDSRDPEVWLEEQAGWHQLCRDLNGFGKIHYRRRTVHLRHKSGNIADFLRRWGEDYSYFMVLDADSVMSGESLVRMVRLMELEPQVGILQTNPTIMNARSAFARIHQFASRAYGAIYAAGLAGLQLGEAAYWGHNALIRTAPFVHFCGLRSLPAFGLFRGPILSHDFVEAAYMRRAGYEVWLEPELNGSYEEYPPTLIDDLTRDRRWTRGNMQHLWLLLFGRRIRFANRMVFFYGIMSYLASPLWLVFLVLSAVEVTRFVLWPINYFSDTRSLFPLWPHWNPSWAMWLAGSTAVVLFLPKVLAVLDLVLSRQTRAYGGGMRLMLSTLLELFVSVLLAPIRMLAHTRFVFEALLNVSLRWAGQNRSKETRWADALRHYAPATAFAGMWSGFAYWLNPIYFYWSLPVTVALVLAAPTTVLLSRVHAGEWLRKRRLLMVPEEHVPPEVMEKLNQSTAMELPPSLLTSFERAVIDPQLNALHVALARHRSCKGPIAEVRARCLELGAQALSSDERAQLAQDGECLSWLHRAVWRAAPTSYWGRLLDENRRRREFETPRRPPPEGAIVHVLAKPELAKAV